MDTHHAAYLAGFLDGEGSFTFSSKAPPAGTNRRRIVNPVICASLTDHETLKSLHEEWGGSLMLRPRKNKKWKDVWHWRLTGEPAKRAAQAVQPHLRTKRKVCDTWLELAELPQYHRNPTGACQCQECCDKSARVSELEAELRRLNARGAGPPS